MTAWSSEDFESAGEAARDPLAQLIERLCRCAVSAELHVEIDGKIGGQSIQESELLADSDLEAQDIYFA